MSFNEVILGVRDLRVQFQTDDGLVEAVSGVNFDVCRGKTLGIVGESGSGKSVSALSVMRLIPSPPGKIVGGTIDFHGEGLLGLSLSQMRKVRGNKIAMIFQEPMTSLNPVFTVGNQVEEVFKLHQKELSSKERRGKAIEMLSLVGIPNPSKRVQEYPHQMSGGMRQRVMIAMALACRPDILIADEPTTALDVTIQAQILDLMNKLQEEIGMGIMMITHDMGVVAETCDDVAVMYCGKIVETAPVRELFSRPSHPYTSGLLESIPSFDSTTGKKRERLQTIKGMVPSLLNLPEGCAFEERCEFAENKCKEVSPKLENRGNGRQVSCFNPLKEKIHGE